MESPRVANTGTNRVLIIINSNFCPCIITVYFSFDYPGYMNIPNSTANNTASNTSDTASGSRSGLTLEGQDLSIRPADDLFHHVNGTWLATHEIPADRALDGAFIQLREDSDARVRSIIDDADTHSRIGALYRSFMDTERLNSLGLTPLEPDLALLSTVTDHRSMALALAELQRVGIGGLLGVFVDQDAKDPSRYVVYLSLSLIHI